MQNLNPAIFNLVAATIVATVSMPGPAGPTPQGHNKSKTAQKTSMPSSGRMVHGYRAAQVGDFDATIKNMEPKSLQWAGLNDVPSQPTVQ